MSLNTCSKSLLDSLSITDLKKSLINCNTNFTYINWINLHYKNTLNQNPETPAFITNIKNSKTEENPNFHLFLLIVSILICFLIIMILNTLSNYMSKIFQRISKKYNISLVLSSLLFMIINFSDDFMILFLNSKKKEFFLFGIGYLMSNFLVYSCAIFGIIVFLKKIELKNFKILFIKEIFFIAIFFILVLVFGFFEIVNYYLAFLILSVYLIYFFYSVFYFEQKFIPEKTLQKELIDENRNGSSDNNSELKDEENKKNNLEEDIEKNIQNEKSKSKEDTENNNNSTIIEEIKKNQEKEISFQNKKPEISTIKSEIWDTDKNLPLKILYRFIITPIKLIFLLTIPTLKIPY